MNISLYIVSYLDSDPIKRAKRKQVHHEQIDWFIKNTNLNIFVVAMQFEKEDFQDHGDRLVYLERSPRKLAEARREAFDHFYASSSLWMIMADNDSTLYDGPQHNSGPKFFQEMERQVEKYSSLGAFYPINPAKYGFNSIYDKDRVLYERNHVFRKGTDLKGSLFFVKNFRLFGEREVMPDPAYTWCEDGKFMVDVIAAGHPVMRCENIILKERGLEGSSFGDATVDRKPFMKEANERIAEEYKALGMKMDQKYPHLLDRREFYKRCWRGPKQLIVPKQEEDPFSLFI